MAKPNQTTGQRIVGTVGIALVTVVVVIVIGAIVGSAFIQTYQAVPLGVVLGLWYFYSSQPKDDKN
jgi:hypothetical protein